MIIGATEDNVYLNIRYAMILSPKWERLNDDVKRELEKVCKAYAKFLCDETTGPHIRNVQRLEKLAGVAKV